MRRFKFVKVKVCSTQDRVPSACWIFEWLNVCMFYPFMPFNGSIIILEFFFFKNSKNYRSDANQKPSFLQSVQLLHTNTLTHQHTNTPTHQHTNTLTHQHTNTLKIHTFRKSVTYQPTTNNVDSRDPTGSKNQSLIDILKMYFYLFK